MQRKRNTIVSGLACPVLALSGLVAVSCAASTFEPAVTFGADDTACESAEIPGDAESSQPVDDGVACLFAEIADGNPVTVDFSIGTVDGDQIFTRYAYDGTEILIVSDDRLDEFGSGSVAAAVCESLVPNPGSVPTGSQCVAVGHDGFTNAEQ